MSVGRWDMSFVMLPSSEQWPRDVLMDHHHLKTPLLQNQPMIIIKTFPLQMLLTSICFFAESKMCLWLINALRNYLLVVFKEIKPAAHFKILFLGRFAQERKFVQLCSAAGGKSSNVCACRGRLILLQIQLFTELL